MSAALDCAVRSLRWIDRHWWAVVVMTFAGTEVAFVLWQPVLLGRIGKNDRGDVYSALSSSSGALLGFTIAAVAILATFSPVRIGHAHEVNLTIARRRLVQVLLATSGFLGLTLVLSTTALGVDRAAKGHGWIEQLTLASVGASTVGLVIGGIGFALAVLERANS